MNYLLNLKKPLISTILAGFAICIPHIAISYSVHDAIIDAHENNYALMSQLEQYKATKLEKPKAIAGMMPKASIQSSVQQNNYKYKQAKQYLNSIGNKYTRNKTLQISQPIFDGGATLANYLIADNQVSAAEASYKDQSSQLSKNVVSAYMSVIAANATLQYSNQNLNLAKETLEYTKTRFEHGEVTKTDVLQSESNYASAISDKEGATGAVQSARATLEHLVGHRVADKLEAVDYARVILPTNVDEVIEFALKNNYQLISSRYTAEQARYGVMQASAAIMPTVSASAQFSRTAANRSSLTNTDGNTYGITLSVPLVARGGAEFATIKQSYHTARQYKFNAQEVERAVRENAISSWSNYKSSLAQLKSTSEAVDYNLRAVEGVMEEAKIGTKTTLDVLTAQHQLFIAQKNHVTTEQNLVNSIHNLLYLMSLTETVDTMD